MDNNNLTTITIEKYTTIEDNPEEHNKIRNKAEQREYQ
jgi:hypothetical protein